jgi:hypothetical protein
MKKTEVKKKKKKSGPMSRDIKRRVLTYKTGDICNYVWSLSYEGSNDCVVFVSPEPTDWYLYVRGGASDYENVEISLAELHLVKDGCVVGKVKLLGTAYNRIPKATILQGMRVSAWA